MTLEEVIWILCYTDGQKRAELLGITKKHYNSKELANQWRDKILNILASNTDNHSDTYIVAINKLDELYKGMIKYGK